MLASNEWIKNCPHPTGFMRFTTEKLTSKREEPRIHGRSIIEEKLITYSTQVFPLTRPDPFILTFQLTSSFRIKLRYWLLPMICILGFVTAATLALTRNVAHKSSTSIWNPSSLFLTDCRPSNWSLLDAVLTMTYEPWNNSQSWSTKSSF